MTRIRSLGFGIWEFVVGDDWQVAIGVVVALALTALLADLIGSAWWTIPAVVLGLLLASVRRAARDALGRE